jgi:hypothetical protein
MIDGRKDWFSRVSEGEREKDTCAGSMKKEERERQRKVDIEVTSFGLAVAVVIGS